MLLSNQVQALAEPGVGLSAPVDGRIRGYGFSAQVTGVARTISTGTGLSSVDAASGHHLVVFSLNFTTVNPPESIGAGSGLALDAKVSVDGNAAVIDTTSLVTTGKATYVVSVPDRAKSVDLQMTAANFTQSFSLTTLRRVGPQPVALYRDPSQPWLTVAVDKSTTVPVVVEADGFASSETLGVKSATLTDFQPGQPSTKPTDPGTAYLAITGTDISNPNPPPGYPSGSHFLGNFSALAPSALTLTLADGTSVPASYSGSTGATGSTGSNLLDGTYYFTVPANLSSATLIINPGTVTGAEYPVFTGNSASVTFPQPATFAISLPPVPATPILSASPTTLPLSGGQLTQPTSATTSVTGAKTLALLIVLVVVVLVVVIAMWRRRRGSPVVSLRHRPPPYRPLRPIALPSPAVPLALPPGLTATGNHPATDTNEIDHLDQHTEAEVEGSTIATAAMADPDVANPAVTQMVEVLVVGPVQITGWAVRPKRSVVSALLCYLVAHPDRQVSGDQMHSALWPVGSNRRDPSRATLHSYLYDLRTALGPGILPDATANGGYGLTGGVVVDDWSTFTTLQAEADAASPNDAGDLRDQALSLVRGPPFAGANGGNFEWTIAEQHVAVMEVAIVRCAHAQVQWCLDRSDHQRAIDAAEIGLLGVPDSYQLNSDLVRAARASGDPASLRRATHQARRSLGNAEADRLVEGSK